MKRVALLGLAAGSLFLPLTACNTPGYTAAENNQIIVRNWNYDMEQTTDDLDWLLMLKPSSRMTIWNVQQGPNAF